MNKPALKLDWCSHEAAKYACEKWHYSGTVPCGKLARIGTWEDGRFVGAVLFGSGSAGVGSIGKGFGVLSVQVAELCRVALTDHATPVTRVVAVAVRLLRSAFPKLRLLVSYADPAEGHHGGIYQGGNWVYTGATESDTYYIGKNGRRYHSRSVKSSGVVVRHGRQHRCPTPENMARKETCPGKHRYLMPLDDEMRKRIEPLRKPYPKRPRAGGVAGDTSANHAGEGGSIPTPALSTCEKVE